MSGQTSDQLLQNRNAVVAKSFFRQLRGEGFSHEQIIDLSTSLLDLVAEDLRSRNAEAQAK